MFFPIGDTQISGGYKPIVSYSLIGINVLVFLLQLGSPGNLICQFSAIPMDVIKGDAYFTLFSSMFMHGSWMHLLGNMLFLWVFADNIEAKIGNFNFLLFYLAGGIFASFVHIYFSTAGTELSQIACLPCSDTNPCGEGMHISSAVIPSLGASGAIAAVMGAYLLMFPKSKVKVLVLVFFQSFYVPAIVFLGLWFVQQLFSGLGSLGPANAATEGVAWWAHIGGFVFGILGGLYLKKFVGHEDESPLKDTVDVI